MVAYNTPLEVIEEIKTRLAQYVSENSREWVSSNVLIDKMEFQNALHLIIVMERELSVRYISSRLETQPRSLSARPSQLARLGRQMGTSYDIYEESQNHSRGSERAVYDAGTARDDAKGTPGYARFVWTFTGTIHGWGRYECDIGRRESGYAWKCWVVSRIGSLETRKGF